VSGQDGAYLAQWLLGKGYDVHGSSRDAQTHGFTNLHRLGIADQVRLHSMAPNDFRSVITTLTRVEPDEVYYLAGQSSVGLSFEQPMETFESIQLGTLNVLEAIRFANPAIRFYHAGSSECFGNTDAQGADENTPFQPRSPYAVAKAAAVWTVRDYRESYGLFACSGILFNHESPLRPTRFVTAKIVDAAYRIAKGEIDTIELGNLDIVRDWGWAPDYVEAMWLMLQQPTPQDFIIATGESMRLRDFVDEAFAAFSLDANAHLSMNKALKRPNDLAHSQGNPSRARQALGWRARISGKALVKRLCEARAMGDLQEGLSLKGALQ